MSTHAHFMQRCLELASLGAGKVAPNPLVGCVIVEDGEVIGEGFHRMYGEAHAEVNAIQSVKDTTRLQRATLYVNLEPCAHHGHTPPCADLIVSHHIPRVVVCNTDPFEKVAGKGIKKLQDAGVEVTTGVLEHEGRWLNRRFFTFHEQQRPYLILKFAQTADGFLDANRNVGDERLPLKITGTEANQLVHKWRSEEAGILVGQTTVALDNPGLTVRHWTGKHPIRMVIDPELQLSEDHTLFQDGHHTWIFNALRTDYCENNLCYIRINDPGDFQSEICQYLHQSGVQSIIIEGGATTLSRFIASGLWDEARIFTGPMRIGAGVPSPSLTGRLIEQSTFGPDQLQVYVPA